MTLQMKENKIVEFLKNKISTSSSNELLMNSIRPLKS